MTSLSDCPINPFFFYVVAAPSPFAVVFLITTQCCLAYYPTLGMINQAIGWYATHWLKVNGFPSGGYADVVQYTCGIGSIELKLTQGPRGRVHDSGLMILIV